MARNILAFRWRSYILIPSRRKNSWISDLEARRGTQTRKTAPGAGSCVALLVAFEGASDPVAGVWATSCENVADDVNNRWENAGLIDREAAVATRDVAKPLESSDRLCANTLGTAIFIALDVGNNRDKG